MGWYTDKESKYVYRVLRGCLVKDGEKIPVTKMDDIKEFFELNKNGTAESLKYYPMWKGTGSFGRNHFYCEGNFDFDIIFRQTYDVNEHDEWYAKYFSNTP